MVLLKWFHFTTCTQLQELLDIVLAAVVPLGRHNPEELTSYFNKKIIPRIANGHLLHVALDNGRVVGFAIFEKWDSQSYYLSDIAILPTYQRQGIGRRLIFSLFEKERHIRKIFLMTEEANLAAQTFYQKIGFKPSSFQHPDYRRHFIGYEYWHLKDQEKLKNLLEKSEKMDIHSKSS